MQEVRNVRALSLLDHGRREPFGVLFRPSGQHRWILGEAEHGRHIAAVRSQRFDRHSGEPWVFMVLAPPAAPPPGSAVVEDPENLVRNPSFRDGEFAWKLEVFRQKGRDPEVFFEPCGTAGGQCVGLRLAEPNDVRLLQEVTFAAGAAYRVRALARAEGVAPPDARGVHLVVMELNAETDELRGTTGWHELEMFVVNPGPAVTLKLALRLGTYGSLTTGTGRFGEVSVRKVDAPEPGARTFTVAPK
jgi:hypothetical protein